MKKQNMPFINDDFLLTTKAAKDLYHNYAEKMPIIDYHCHLPPSEIANDQRWNDIAEVWLGGDHYKWRQLRSNGCAERLCTGRGADGNATGWEKFEAYALAMERLIKNPLFDWSHLELARYFGITDRLCGASAKRIYSECNKVLKKKWFSAQGLMTKSNVKVVCTTDDPIDTLEHHIAISKNPFGTQVRPTWRSDKASKIDNLSVWNPWMDALAKAAKMEIKSYDDFMSAMAKRHEFFEKSGCVLADYGVGDIYATDYTEAEIKRIFKKARGGKVVTQEEALKFKSAWLFEGLKADAKANWTTQIHYNCLRDLNSTQFKALGPDTGFDAIGDWRVGQQISKLFDNLEKEDALPRCILYSLNPGDNEMLCAIMGSFQKAPYRGKLQLGSAWWFLDQKDGMRRQLDALGALGILGNFVGMLTDSRSFISYTRHEYFRRLLCQKLGEEIEKGELPNDIKWIGSLVSDISFNNANNYFGFNVK